MFFMMAISLYTSRVVLNTLGVEDFGIYNVVGGLVSMFGLLSGSMSGATQRYITFSLGRDDNETLNKVFCLSLQIHALMSVITVLLIETVGIWFLYNKMVIPPARLTAAFWLLQISAVTFVFSLMSVPYNADIVSHERMSAFAYISIIEAILKLGIVFLLVLSPFDKLIVYAALLALVQIVIQLCYMTYCHHHFSESHYHYTRDWILFREMASYAGWSLFGSFSAMAFNQGLSMLLNVFFGPVVNAARAVASQVMAAIQLFINNFQMALNPQITKTYAQGDFTSLHLLMFRSSRFSFFLMYLLSLPVLLEAPLILKIWLHTVPDYTVIFLRLIICTSLIYTIVNPILVANGATGKVRNYNIVCGTMMISILPISYVVLKLGAPAYSVFIVHFCIESLTQVARLIMVRWRLHLPIRRYVTNVYLPILLVICVSTIVPVLLYLSIEGVYIKFFVVVIASVLSVAATSFYIGFTRHERSVILERVKYRLNRQ
jgi:O-antigen/teichoic acid export membrane protein